MLLDYSIEQNLIIERCVIFKKAVVNFGKGTHFIPCEHNVQIILFEFMVSETFVLNIWHLEIFLKTIKTSMQSMFQKKI